MTLPSLLPDPSANTEQSRLEAAEAAVRAYCGWHIAPVITEEMILDGSGSCTLQLPSLMVKEITAAVVDGVTLDAQTLEWSKSGFVRATGRWTNRLRGVRLTVKHGFDAAPDVVEIIRSVAARAGSSPAGITREQAGQVSITYATVAPGVAGGTVLMEHERAMLEPYRLTGRL